MYLPKRIKEIFKKAISASEEFDKLYKSEEKEAKTQQIRNCPFCDGSPQLKRYSAYSQLLRKVITGYYIKCPICGAQTDLELEAAAVINKWNTRIHEINSSKVRTFDL